MGTCVVCARRKREQRQKSKRGAEEARGAESIEACMASKKGGGLSRPAQVGIFTLASVALLVGALYLFTSFGGRHAGYRMGLHLANASGLSPGGQVLFSGVPIGVVNKVELLPDGSVDVLINVTRDIAIPRASIFRVQSSFTGSPYIWIVPPHHYAPSDVLPKRLVPVSQQPVGTPPLAIEQFMAQGKALGSRAQAILRIAHGYSGRLMAPVTAARAHAAQTQTELKGIMPGVLSGLQGTLAVARARMQTAQNALRARDQRKIDAIAAAFQSSSRSMQRSAQELQGIAHDPAERSAVREASAQLRIVSANMAALGADMKIVARNPQTRAELADAGKRLRAVMQKVRSLIP